jgi:hypothetical protein
MYLWGAEKGSTHAVRVLARKQKKREITATFSPTGVSSYTKKEYSTASHCDA